MNALGPLSRWIEGAFGDPFYLALGGVVLLTVAAGLWSHAVRRRRLARFLGGPRAVERLSNTNLYRYRWERLVLLGGAALVLGAAAAEPRWGTTPPAPPPPPPQRQVMIALDVSASMQAPDEAPTRLAAAAEVARRIIASVDDQKVGLLLFAGEPYLLSPPTADSAVLDYLLSGVTSTIASAQDPGTRLAAAISGAAAAFAYPGVTADPSMSDNLATPIRSIVVVSDGDSGETESEITLALEAAAGIGATVHTVRLGGTDGAPMVMPRGQYQLGGPVLAADGSRAVSRARPALLARIADLGDGVFIDVPASGLAPLVDYLRPPVEPLRVAAEAGSGVAFDPAAWLVAIALVALALESLLDIRMPRLARIARRRYA